MGVKLKLHAGRLKIAAIGKRNRNMKVLRQRDSKYSFYRQCQKIPRLSLKAAENIYTEGKLY